MPLHIQSTASNLQTPSLVWKLRRDDNCQPDCHKTPDVSTKTQRPTSDSPLYSSLTEPSTCVLIRQHAVPNLHLSFIPLLPVCCHAARQYPDSSPASCVAGLSCCRSCLPFVHYVLTYNKQCSYLP